MKLLPSSGALLALLAFPMAASAAFTTTFDGLTSGAGTQVAGQNGWTINDATAEISFPVVGVGTNKYAALGGYQSAPGIVTPINLLNSAGSQTAAGSTFTASYALINRSGLAGAAGFASTDPDDWFGFTLGDGTGEILNIGFRPTATENTRQLFNNGVGVTPNGITASDYANPLLTTLTVSFTNVGGALNYTGSTAGGGVTFNGSIAGKGTTTFTTVGMFWDVQAATGAGAGQNFLLVDSLSLVPEPSASLMGLLSIGLLAARRRR